MGWGKISKLMESNMNICLLIWFVDWVTVLPDCLFESKSNNLLDWVTVCLTAWLCEEWMAVCLTVWLFGWLSEWLFFFFCLSALLVYIFLRFFVRLFVFSYVYVHLLLFNLLFVSLILHLWVCLTVLILLLAVIDWVNDCLLDYSREWLRLFNWVNPNLYDWLLFWRSDWGRDLRRIVTGNNEVLKRILEDSKKNKKSKW